MNTTFPSRPEYTEHTIEALALDSAEVLRMPIETLAEIVSESYGGLHYRCTENEIGALDWIGGRYSSAEKLAQNLNRETRIVTIDPAELSVALADDGSDKVPCLSEDTALQRLAWLCHDEQTAGQYEASERWGDGEWFADCGNRELFGPFASEELAQGECDHQNDIQFLS